MSLEQIRYPNGDIYVGGIVDGKRNGRGTMTYHSSKGFYKGEWKNDMKHGQGKLTDKNGDQYEGEFQEGLKHGHGIYKAFNGAIYEGEFQEGKRNGHGYMTYANGDRYEGNFVDNKKHGHGKFTDASGAVYVGEFSDGLPNGNGTFTAANGGCYSGEFQKGAREGKGILTWAHGGKYEGDFHQGNRHGKGTMMDAEGNVYEGEWKDNVKHGNGRFTYASNGATYEGKFKHGSRSGKEGRLEYANGDIYEGEFKNNNRRNSNGVGDASFSKGITCPIRQGKGVLKLKDGSVYTGDWKDDCKHGKGIFTEKKNDGEGSSYEGEWKDDKRHGTGVLKWHGSMYSDRGSMYSGKFRDGDFHGHGAVMYADGSSYHGQWRNGLKHGQGKLENATTGEVYDGEWKEGKKDGVGMYTDADGNVYRGGWRADVKHGKGITRCADGTVSEGRYKDGKTIVGEAGANGTVEKSNEMNNLMQNALEKAKSDPDFKRKSTHNMARDVAQSLIDDDGDDEDHGTHARNSITGSIQNLFHSALNKAKSDSDFSRNSTRSVTRNAAQALMSKADGDSAFRKGNHKEAIEKYIEAIEIDPENAGYFASLSAVYLKMGDNSEALEDANAAIELDPKLARGHCLKGEALLALERCDQAVYAYEEGLKNCPNNSALQYGLDNANRCRDNMAAAAAAADSSKSEENSKLPQATGEGTSEGHLSIDGNDNNESTTQLSSNGHVEDNLIHSSAGVNAEKSNEPVRSTVTFNDVNQVHFIPHEEEYAMSSTSNASGKNNLMQTAMEKAKSDRNFNRKSTRKMARDVAQSLIDEGNDDSGDYARSNSTGSSRNLMHSASDKAKSDSNFRRDSTRKVTRNVAQALMSKADGDIASWAGDYETAVAKYTEAIAIDPENSGYFASRSAVYLKMGNSSKALEDADASIELDPNSARGYCFKGEVLVKLKKYDAAVTAYQEGLNKRPDNLALQDGLSNAKRKRVANNRWV